MMGSISTAQRSQRTAVQGLTWRVLLGLVMLAGTMMAFTPPRGTSSSASIAGQQGVLVVHVVDIISKEPIHGAFVKLKGVAKLVLTDAQGRATLTPPVGGATVSVEANHPHYMGTMLTRIDPSSTKAVLVGMPHLKKLAQADQLIRDPHTLLSHRHQAILPPADNMPRAVINQRHLPIGTPIAITYPMPANIKVKKTDGSIITLPLEEYLKGVLPREIGSSFPAEAMKAQAVAARTYTLRYTQGGQNAICTTTQCQVWGTTQYAATSKAVDDTKSQVAVYVGSDAAWKGKLAGGYFAASCGGSTLSSKDGGWSYRPFLQGVTCIENKVDSCSRICNSTASSSQCWGKFGHRIGLCQRGAQAMGKCGKTYVQIVKHYYTDVEIANLAPNPVDNAALVRETVPAGTKYRTGQSFTKEWRMKNTGNTQWTSSAKYALIRVDGTSFGAGASITVSANVAANAEHSFKISMTTPAKAGSYKARWQMAKDGKKFGQVVEVSIIAEEPPPTCVDNDKDGFPAPAPGCPLPHDCDDNNKDIHPNAREICGNGIDEDCKDGDLKCPVECKDVDGDGYYAKNDKCPAPYDCDDNNKDINPAAKEICGNGKDDDCNGGDLKCPVDCFDKDGDGYSSGSGCTGIQDCDDNNKNIYPGAPEICGNGIDEDCREGDRACDPNNPNNPNNPTNPTKKPLGSMGCTKHSDCESGVCVEYSGQSICTVKCNAGTSCPATFQCLQGQACWPQSGSPSKQCRSNLECSAAETCAGGQCVPAPKKGCGCYAAGTRPELPGSWWLWVLLAGLGVVRLRRR